MKLLEVNNIVKKIKGNFIINNANLELNEGEILGFIGKNGIGKTTFIKILLGLVKFDSGSVFIDGYNLITEHDNALKQVGAIIESPDLYMYLTGYQNLKLIAKIYNKNDNDILKVINLVKLNDSIYQKVNTYSLGMRQRLGIAQALLIDPKLLILDEPFNGLDPIGIKDLKSLFISLAKKENKSIIISSHILSELELFCTNICTLKNGNIVFLEKKYNDNKLVQFKIMDIEALKKINCKYEIVDKNTVNINTNYKEIPGLIRTVSNIVDIYEVKEIKDSLEDIFVESLGG